MMSEDQINERTFIFLRIDNTLEAAGLLASNYGMGLEDFLKLAEDAFVYSQGHLAHLRKQLTDLEALKPEGEES